MSAAVAVARRYGLEVTEPRVVRDLSNVMVHLAPSPVIARVATTTAAARPDGARAWLARDVEMGGWLYAQGAAVVAPAGGWWSPRPNAPPRLGLAGSFACCTSVSTISRARWSRCPRCWTRRGRSSTAVG